MPSRREQIKMTPEEIQAYLQTQIRLIIVSNGPAGYPQPLPMNFVLDEQNRFVVTSFRKGQKVKNFERDPKAALLIESGIAYSELKSVLVYAEAEIIDDAAMVVKTMGMLMAKEVAEENKSENANLALGAQGKESAPKRVVIRFTPHQYITWDHSKLGGQY